MQTLHPGDVSTTIFGWQPTDDEDVLGFFAELEELEYRVLNVAGAEQVAWTVVDVDADAVEGHPGLYAPSITVPALSTSYGTWTVQWRFTVETGDDQQTSTTYFRVVALAQPIADAYAQVQDLLDEGVPSALFTSARMVRALELASRLFEEWTGRTFGPRVLDYDVDGRGGPILQLEQPIIGLTAAALTFTSFSTSDMAIESGDLRVYNRHIRSNLKHPDDRQDPRVEWLRLTGWGYPRRGSLGEADLISAHAGFPESQQNVKLSGVFGYTDFDGTPFGKVPDLVREAVMRIAMTKLAPLWAATGGGSGIGISGPIQSEKTMDQSVSYANLAASGSGAYVGAYTGDPAVDQLILTFKRPPLIRGA